MRWYGLSNWISLVIMSETFNSGLILVNATTRIYCRQHRNYHLHDLHHFGNPLSLSSCAGTSSRLWLLDHNDPWRRLHASPKHFLIPILSNNSNNDIDLIRPGLIWPDLNWSGLVWSALGFCIQNRLEPVCCFWMGSPCPPIMLTLHFFVFLNRSVVIIRSLLFAVHASYHMFISVSLLHIPYYVTIFWPSHVNNFLRVTAVCDFITLFVTKFFYNPLSKFTPLQSSL